MKRLSISIFILALSLQVMGQMTTADFEKILNKAQSGVKKTNIELSINDFQTVSYWKQTSNNIWEFGLQSWAPNNSTSTVAILKTIAIIKLLGDGYEFYSVSQEIDPDIIDDILNAKYVAVGQKYLLKKINYAEVTFGQQDNRHTLAATSSLDGKEKLIAEDITNMLSISRGLLHNIAFEVNRY